MRIYFSLSVSFTDSLCQEGKQLELSSTLTMSSKQLRSTQAGMTIAMYFFSHQKLPLMVHHVVTIVHPSQLRPHCVLKILEKINIQTMQENVDVHVFLATTHFALIVHLYFSSTRKCPTYTCLSEEIGWN